MGVYIYRYPRIQIILALGPKVYKYYLQRAIWILRVWPASLISFLESSGRCEVSELSAECIKPACEIGNNSPPRYGDYNRDPNTKAFKRRELFITGLH